MDSVRVRIGGADGYDAQIGGGLLGRCGALLAEVLPPCVCAVVTDERVAPLYLARTSASLESAGFRPVPFVFPGGEQTKNMATLTALLEFFAASGLTRADAVVALGGGVVGDLAGFAAGVYLRGVACAQFPTTLLAGVDASVGGKSAVDLAAGKNLAGIFRRPVAVVCDTDCYATLPPDALADGVAECVKYGVLCDAALFARFADGVPIDTLPEITARCVAVKANYVDGDERDTGRRRFLNLGHTVGHAIERCSDYAVPHGHAVAAGLAVVARAAERRGFAVPGTARSVECVLARCGLPVTTGYPASALAAAAMLDKKRRGDAITLVVPLRVGECALYEMLVGALEGWIAEGL